MNIMKLEIKQTGSTTSLYDGKLEVCRFVTGSRKVNEKYAHEIIKLFAIPVVVKSFVCEQEENRQGRCETQCLGCDGLQRSGK